MRFLFLFVRKLGTIRGHEVMSFLAIELGPRHLSIRAGGHH